MNRSGFSVGLTGGIGSGKSFIADLFAKKGASVIDTDVIAHQLTDVGGAALPAINAQFGGTFFTENGAMDRVKMRELIFADPLAKKQLETILHPLIANAAERAASLAQGAYLLFVVPLLVESGTWKNRVSRILVVDCPEALQVQRVMQRNKLSEAQVRAIMTTQATRAERLAAADDVLMNDGDVSSLLPTIDTLHTEYTSLGRTSR